MVFGRKIVGATIQNLATFKTGQKDVTTAGTAEQLPNQAVPNGASVVVKAKYTNLGNIYYGNTKANAENVAVRNTLQPNETIELIIVNIGSIWIDADIDGEGIEWTVETSV